MTTTQQFNLVEGFVINRDELETLAYHYFLNRLYHEWDQFKGNLTDLQDDADYHEEGLRLNVIEPFLGLETMAKMKKMAEAQFVNSQTTGRLSNDEWAEFSGVKQ